jgi:acyl dehydratase
MNGSAENRRESACLILGVARTAELQSQARESLESASGALQAAPVQAPQELEQMSVPYKERYFEDYTPGETVEFGEEQVTEQEIVEFATRYDPQPFHIDPEAARESIYGGLIASGWMTGGILMRMLVDNFIPPAASMGSPGIDELRWHKPVRAGDRLRARVTVLETRRSESKPDRGVIRFLQEAINQNGETVMSVKGMGMYKCRS